MNLSEWQTVHCTELPEPIKVPKSEVHVYDNSSPVATAVMVVTSLTFTTVSFATRLVNLNVPDELSGVGVELLLQAEMRMISTNPEN